VGDTLDELRLWDGAPLPPALRARLQREGAHAQFLHEQILALERERQRGITHGEGRGPRWRPDL
jgi:hypothetical protein